jgi:subtilisin family serine protease
VYAQDRFTFIENDTSSFVENELIIWLEQGVDAKEFAVRSAQKIEPKRCLFEELNIWLFEFADEKGQRNMAQRNMRMNNLASNNQVKYVQNNHTGIDLRGLDPDDPYYNGCLYGGPQWAPPKIGLPDVWEEFTIGGITTTGDNIVVAVIDNGFYQQHEDLNFWKNINDPINGADDDGNGYVDDYNGWNAYNNTYSLLDSLHGTAVSGVIGAIGNNGKGISGINWNGKISPVCGSISGGNEAVVIEAYRYVYQMRSLYNETNGQKGAFIVVTNSSFGIDWNKGGNPSNFPIWCALYDVLGNVGILSCVSVINANDNIDIVGDMPSGCSSEYLIAVTNTTEDDTKYYFAGYGVSTVDIGAPGTDIYTTVPGVDEFGYAPRNGTSFASPHVAGVIALMYAAMPQNTIQTYKNNPADFALFVKRQLLDGADEIPALEGLIAESRRLNAYEAVRKAQCDAYLLNQDVITNNILTASCDINVQNVEVEQGVTLILDAEGTTKIQSIKVELGAGLKIQ